MKKILTVVLLSLLIFSGCASKKEDTIIIANGDYGEMYIFSYMAEILIKEYTDYDVEVTDYMSVSLAQSEIKAGRMHVRLSYDGTMLATFLNRDVSEVPSGMSIFDYANERAIDEYGIKLFNKLGFENTYAVAVRRSTAEKYNLKTISDLSKVASELRFGTEDTFFNEDGTIRFIPFTDFYELDFKSSTPISTDLKYIGMDSEQFDVTLAFSTDGMILKTDLILLEDDKRFFPEYNATYVLSTDLEDKYPGVEEALNKVAGLFNQENTIALNYRVDVLDEDPYLVAYEFLKEHNLVN
jgi:glycine betaine/choline ABC-type transport system substrate-binding protein